MIRALALFAFAAAYASAAVTGTVINASTGKPQAGATVGLNRLGQNGIELIDQAKSDAQGNFTINQPVQGPHLLRTAFDGVTYNHMLPPGSPTTGITVEVYNASSQPGDAKVSKHMILFEPTGAEMVVNESFIYQNTGNTAWNNPDKGTLAFFLPAATNGKVEVKATAPGGMPIGAPVTKTSKPDIYAVDFAIKPGETRFDLTYSLPYTAGRPYECKIVTKDENTYLIAPNGITLTGENLTDLGAEPRTQAHIFGLKSDTYKIQLTGTEAAPPASGDTAAGESDSSGPQIEQIMPRVYNNAKLILGLALGILALGFALLYRMNPQAAPTKESNERGRR